MESFYDVIVIGGGQSGLAIGYYLRRVDLKWCILDNQEEGGGAWLHTWDSLRLFSPAYASSLPGWPMPDSKEEYPDRASVIQYLKAYENRYQLSILRPVSVKGVKKNDEGLFQLDTTEGLVTCRALVNTTGTWRNPYIPGYPGRTQFKGTQIHSAQYKRPEPFKNQRVLIVGGGNSGAQILAEVSHFADTIWVTKEEPEFLPDDVDGRYLFNLASQDYKQGGKPGDSIFNLGQIVVVPPVKEARDRGVLKANPPFRKFYEEGVEWHDGTQTPIDTVIWCTGFKPALKHLRGLAIFKDGKYVPVENNESVYVKNLWFAGYGNWTGYASATLIGVGRTAKSIVQKIRERF